MNARGTCDSNNNNNNKKKTPCRSLEPSGKVHLLAVSVCVGGWVGGEIQK